ncbi:threonine synthase [Aminobacter aminovorans]|uniref:Threonine synthase-like protein n=1 Tax=Aminobacter aminovorans TaxID=83263 RepID=A0AAC8YTL9_AMIAI|nr:threonine synthase [Aminobacter aminovorans]AMS43989.1 Threonine synthase-like protein [Aminobacter aminovorans]WMC98213.1 threonine synthase [Aminobacter aminovorans]
MATISGYSCIRCGSEHASDIRIDSRGCPRCVEQAPANLQPIYTRGADTVNDQAEGSVLRSSLWRYGSFLPRPSGPVVSLGEGLTPLLPAERLGEALGVPQLFIKDEGRNPTGSHKDRFSTVAVSMARGQGARVLATASSGNAGASLAAYAAKSGLGCVVATFAGAAGPMLSQIHAYGASVIPMADKSDRWKLLEKAADRLGWFVTSPYQHPVVGSHPLGIEGYKTIAYEIAEQADGHLPDWCVLPVCYGDALAGVAAGFHDLLNRGAIARVPRLVAAEVHGSLSKALENGFDRIEEQGPSFETIALSIGTTRSTYQAVKALRDTGGHAVCVSNEKLIRMQKTLAAKEGLFVELASVAPLVAIQDLRDRQIIAPGDRVVAVVTATGLKDLDISANPAATPAPFESVEAAWQWATRRHAAEPAAA